jgi:membrane protease YdiL (CAAX protease family)
VDNAEMSWAARHEVTLFMVLAFAISWSVWPLVLLNPASSAIVPFGPAVAAVVVAGSARGRQGLRDLLGQLLRFRGRLRWFGLAVVLPAIAITLAAVGATVLGAQSPDAPTAADWIVLPATILSTVILVGLFEEIGWRGFALPALQVRLGFLGAALVVGVTWALWHLPLLISDPTRQRPAAQFVILVVAQSVVFAYVYGRTRGSLPVVILLHACINSSVQFVFPRFEDDDYGIVWWCLTGVFVVLAIVVVARPRYYPGSIGV